MLVPLAALAQLEPGEARVAAKLFTQLQQKQSKNELLDVYYDGHRVFTDLGISIPPQMKQVRAALGWPAKAVKALARKHVFEGFSLDGAGNPFDIDELLTANRFGVELVQAINGAYKHAVSFLTVSQGDPLSGEPAVLVQAHDALWSTAHWNPRLRRIDSFLTVTAHDGKDVSEFVLMFPGVVVTARRNRLRGWRIERRPGIPDRVLAEPLVYDPQLGRPFGHSRISREVRYLTDAAVRTLVRTETSAEFFASPQRWLMGVDDKAFDMGKWSAITGRILAISKDEDGDSPTVGEFKQTSMEPHLSMYRQLAQNFCAATDLPMSAVGLFTDNPASAEAMQAAEAALASEAEYQWQVFAPALTRVVEAMVMVRDRLTEPPENSWKVRVNHAPARYVSPQAAADFVSKAVAAVPKIAETTEALRGLGFASEQIEGMQAEWRRANASSVLDRVLTRQPEAQNMQ